MPRKRKLIICQNCKEEKGHAARGLCAYCYRQLPDVKQKNKESSDRYRNKNRDKIRERDRIYKAKQRKKDPEKYRTINNRWRERNLAHARALSRKYNHTSGRCNKDNRSYSIYVARVEFVNGDTLIKIGMSSNPCKRIKALVYNNREHIKTAKIIYCTDKTLNAYFAYNIEEQLREDLTDIHRPLSHIKNGGGEFYADIF